MSDEPLDLSADLVPGDQPVPITVWRTAREPSEDPGPIPRRLAYRLIAAYSRPVDAVIDLTPGHALTAAALAGARRHHKAWFTEASALIVGPSTTDPGDIASMPDAVAPSDARSPDTEPHEATVQVGRRVTDDLIKEPPAHRPPSEDDLHATTRLVVASWPLASGGPDAEANQVRLGWLLSACAQLLRPGGCLVLVVSATVGGAGAVTRPEDFRPVIDAARAAGLGYLQHIVAVHADTDGDQFVYHASDTEVLGLARVAAGTGDAAHRRVHADLIVLTYRTATPPPASGRRP